VLDWKDEEELVAGSGDVKSGGTGVTRSGSSPNVRFGKASIPTASRPNKDEWTWTSEWLFIMKCIAISAPWQVFII